MILNESQLKTLLRNVYISDGKCLNYNSDLYGKIMLITANCGRGKTYYALSLGEDGMLAEINRLRKRNNLFVKDLEDIKPCEVLFLTSRKVIAGQQLKNANCVKAEAFDFDYNMNNWENADRENKILVSTAHRFGDWVREGKIKKIPKVIVIDELHSIFTENTFAESLLYTLEFVKDNYNDMIKIGLTATPQFLYKYLDNGAFGFETIDIDLGSKHKVNDLICAVRGQASTILKQEKPKIDSNHKVIYYTMSAKECYKLSKEYGNRSAFLISDYNDTVIDGVPLVDIMNEAGVKQYIIENERLPEDIDIIFINSACREGMNIKDKSVKMVICEAVDMITIEQILGRIRGDLEKFMVVCNFNNEERIKKNIKDYESFLRALDECENEQVLLSHRHGEQKQNKRLLKYVYQYKGEYKLNPYIKPYLQYINESYIQIHNYETKSKGNYICKIAERDLLLCDDYLKQLCRYAENGRIDIEMVWNNLIEKNHENALEAFKAIENDWLGKPIGTEEKKVLVDALKVVRCQGKKASWKTVKDMLLDAGYTVADKKSGSKRYSVITK